MAIITKLRKKDFSDILKNYKIGQYINHIHINWALTNTVYELRTTKGKFILKIFEKAKPDFIKFQVKLMRFLKKNSIPVPKLIKTNKGNNLLIYKNKNILVQEFIGGSIKEVYNKELLKDIAGKFGIMCKRLQNLKIPGKSQWKKDYQYIRQKGELVISGFNFKKESKKIFNNLKSVDRKKLRRGIVHGDFHGVNLIVSNNKLMGITDFDDSHKDYLAYEVAVFLIDAFITKKGFKKNPAKLFFSNFQTFIKFNNEEKKAMYFFVKHRLLVIIAWTQNKMQVHKDHKTRLSRSLIKMILKYQSFDKLTLKEFAELF